MSKFPLVLAVLGTSVSSLAQVACDPMPSQIIYTHNPWVANSYIGSGTPTNPGISTMNLYFDLEVMASSIVLTDVGIILYDQGIGNPPVVNQLGNVAIVNIYTISGTRAGNEMSMTGWTHAGTGEMTVASFEGYSQVINIVDPVTNGPTVLLNGTMGVCLELVPTNAVGTPPQTGPNAVNVGSLHTLMLNPNPMYVWEDQFVKIDNDAIQNNAWQQTGSGVGPFPLTPSPSAGGFGGSININLGYTVAAGDGAYLAYGEGCYERFRTAYEDIPPSLSGPDLVDPTTPIGATGGMTWLFNGSSYTVTPGAQPYVTPTSTSITTGAYGVSNSGTWSAAISTPYTFPSNWTGGGFEHPAGVATQFGVGSKGFVYLDDVTIASPLTCGPPNGFLAGATEYAPSIRPFHSWIDPTLGGGIHVDFDPVAPPQWVRVSWDQLPEPNVPTSVSTFSLTMFNGGNFEIAYVSLGNQTVANPTANALVGYFEGNMAPIGPPISWNAFIGNPMPQTGNGDVPPVLSLDARPLLGTSVNFVTSNLASGTLGGVFAVSLNGTAPVSLASFGAPGCFGHIDIQNGFVGANFLGLNANNEISVPLIIPSNPAFLSTNFHCQTLTLLPGVNALGSQSSNGLCANLGN